MSESSGETSAMSGTVEWNAEPALARPSSARPRASGLPGAWWQGRRSHPPPWPPRELTRSA
eukprot:scaffold22962_cov64-Phaeocystis_antarctica.AAC.2